MNRALFPFAVAAGLILPSLAEPADLDAQLRDLAAVEEGFALLDDLRAAEAHDLFDARWRVAPGSAAAAVGLVRAARAAGRPAAELDDRFAAAARAGSPSAVVGQLELALLASGGDASTAEGRSPVEELLKQLEGVESASLWVAFGRARDLVRQHLVRQGGSREWSYVHDFDLRWSVTTRQRGPGWNPPAAAREALRPLLAGGRGALLFWRFHLEELADGGPADLAAARAAVEAHPDSPLAPAVLLECARRETDGERRWEELEAIEARYPTSPYRDDVRLERVRMIENTRPGQAVRLLEELLDRQPGDPLGTARDLLARLYLETGRPEEALVAVRDLEEKEGVTRHQRAAECLTALGDLSGAEDRLRRRLDELKDYGESPIVHRVRLELAANLSRQGRHDEALRIYDELPDSAPRGWRFFRTLLQVYSFPLAASLFHIFLLLLSFALGVIVFVVHFRRARRHLVAAASLAGLSALLQSVHALGLGEGLSGNHVGYLSLVFARNLVFVSAGVVLLQSVGVRQSRLLLPRRQPGAQGTRSPLIAVGVSLAVVLVLVALWTAALFWLHPPRLGSFYERMSTLFRGSEYSVLLGQEGQLASRVLLVVAAALNEELLFRSFLLGVFAVTFSRLLRRLGSRDSPPAPRVVRRRAFAGAVVATTLLWALPHAGMVDPGWWKMAQLSGFGLLLGWLSWRRGLGVAILAHALFNGGAVWIGDLLRDA
ncbi:MAG: CPBP family glutamic-type intramembrane protease [Planctomycetota bacterium]|nr:CPBP family glutamic-type intramembrane protease [Planctomycetota bacterium]